MKYGIISGGNSSHSKKIFTLQKKIVRLMAGGKPRDSCKNLFKRLEILTLPCKYIFSLMIFIVKNQEFFQTQGIRISFIDELPTSHVFRRVLIMLALKFLSLPSNLTVLKQIQFKIALHSFYSVDEFMFSNNS
jgi:hypothetical protein